ncbi:MAG: trimethylamine methyltransferase family protein, partial [Rhodobacteraceae bacterium]|nr:trimethylamine methyltransferase family protein [Paracoccaceae bacterium]MCB2157742.1 trimethylamine methyltransferase family protein [Paracoccaceae bacterium]
WTERGAPDASSRATGIWKRIVAEDWRAPLDPGRIEAMNDYITRRTADGGAPPES